jgi:hypothetical protein
MTIDTISFLDNFIEKIAKFYESFGRHQKKVNQKRIDKDLELC